MLFQYILLVIAYLLGAIPFAVILGKKFKGIDVRKHGSGNPGGTNSLRFLGKKLGMTIIVLDVIKGGLIVLLVHYNVFGDVTLLHPVAYGLAASLGHVFSVFIHFRGGKAVATTVGTIMAYNMLYAIILCVIFFIFLKLTKYVSVGSTAVAVGLIIIALIFQDYNLLLYGGAISLLIIYRHQSNYKNIIAKKESKVTWIGK
ncbi:MAG: glycerol-3-phosphate 1-O-acyltransferase PlsY [Bacilli bacterium]|nr:glycerol-3-phosphate 1-O-acyltransferase PlsY [Bacilli bacterium]